MSYLPLRLQPGSDLRRSLEAAVNASGEGSAFVVSGIGSLSSARLRLAGAESETSLTGMFEILCISGTLTPNGAHLHMAIADQHGRVLGGHVCYGNTVRTTAEALLAHPTKWTLEREHDANTGFSELIVRPAGKHFEDATEPFHGAERSEPFVFKRATAADMESLLTLMHGFYAEAGLTLNRGSSSAALHDLLSSPSLGCVWLAQLDNVAVGHTVLTLRFTMEHEGLSGYIDDLYVEPRYRRLGVGRGLLRELVAESHSRGCKSLQVQVGQDNAAALSLYGKLGLHATGDGRVLASGPLPGTVT
jgi:uncharacterized protein